MKESDMFLTRSLCMNQKQGGALVGVKGDWLGAYIRLKDEEEIVIGRDASMCSLIISENGVSRRHCSVVYHESTGQYSVWDWSSNGTFLGDGTRMAREKEYRLAPGTELWIGNGKNIMKLG